MPYELREEPAFVKACLYEEFHRKMPEVKDPVWISIGWETFGQLAYAPTPKIKDAPLPDFSVDEIPWPKFLTPRIKAVADAGAEKDPSCIGSDSETSMREVADMAARPVHGSTVRQKGTTRFVFCLAPEDIQEYELVPKLIGRGGSIVKTIATSHNAKLRFRGLGSGRKEVNGPHGKAEANIPLQLCVSCPDREVLDIVRTTIMELLDRHEKLFARHCKRRNKQKPEKFYFELP
jgi:hypothetical protein